MIRAAQKIRNALPSSGRRRAFHHSNTAQARDSEGMALRGAPGTGADSTTKASKRGKPIGNSRPNAYFGPAAGKQLYNRKPMTPETTSSLIKSTANHLGRDRCTAIMILIARGSIWYISAV